jgi:hypothetical protein
VDLLPFRLGAPGWVGPREPAMSQQTTWTVTWPAYGDWVIVAALCTLLVIAVRALVQAFQGRRHDSAE